MNPSTIMKLTGIAMLIGGIGLMGLMIHAMNLYEKKRNTERQESNNEWES